MSAKNKESKYQLKPAILLDRDGVLIQRHDLTWKKEQMRLSPRIVHILKSFNKQGVPVIVITNQPVVARGWISEDDVNKLHDILQNRLKKQGAFIDRFYFCPHHPEATLDEYRQKCACRKPGIGLIKKAAKEFNIDLEKSFFIGDMTQDILAGKRAKVKTILLTNSGYKGNDGKFKIEPNHKSPTLSSALTMVYKLWFNAGKR